MTEPFFFGYGSLVNRRTHSFPQAKPARIRGWGRRWTGTLLRKVAYLTAIPDSSAEITGLVAAVPGADWVALDERERAYRRHPVDAIDHDHPAGALQVQIYAVDPIHAEDETEHPILLSYLDTVIQGYLAEYGEAGAAAFFETTGGWDLPILDDRAAPIYPRATKLTTSERAFVDDALRALRR